MKLAHEGLLLLPKRDRRIYFVNNSKKDRLDYIVEKIDISLEDIFGDAVFNKHSFRLRILNDSISPLSYIQFRGAGDIARTKEEVSFKARDMTKMQASKIYFLEDSPQEKRIVIELVTAIGPNERRVILIEYLWPEPEHFHSFTASTNLKAVKFSLISKNKFSLSVSRTNSGRTETGDESDKVTTVTNRRGEVIERYENKGVPPFALLNFKWKQVKSWNPNEECKKLDQEKMEK